MQHLKAGAFGALVFGLVGWNASPERPILTILAAVAGFSAGYFGYRFSEVWSAVVEVLEKTLESTVAFLKRPHPFLYPSIAVGLTTSFTLLRNAPPKDVVLSLILLSLVSTSLAVITWLVLSGLATKGAKKTGALLG